MGTTQASGNTAATTPSSSAFQIGATFAAAFALVANF